MNSPKYIARLLKYDKMWLVCKWIDIKYGIYHWFLDKTTRWRFKHSKKLILNSDAYYAHNYEIGWDDVQINDQWGFWMPLCFTICSKKNWEFDNEMNKKCDIPEEPWRDEHECDCKKKCGYTTYYFKEDYLNSNHYFMAARKELKKLGEKAVGKELELRLFTQSQKDINKEMIQHAEWIKAGKPKFKVEFADQAKEGFEKMLGKEEAQKLFDEQAKKNKEIDRKKGEQIIDRLLDDKKEDN